MKDAVDRRRRHDAQSERHHGQRREKRGAEQSPYPELHVAQYFGAASKHSEMEGTFVENNSSN